MNATQPKSPTTNGGAAAAAAPATTAAPPPQANPFTELLAFDRTSDRFKLGLEPGIADQQTLDAAWADAEAAVNAKMVDTADEAYARIRIGRPLGIPAMASIQHISFIENKKTGLRTPCMMAKQKLALCLARRDLVEYIEPETLSNTEAVFVGKRVTGRKEIRIKFTIEDAKLAGLVDRGSTEEGKAGNNYTKHPGPMLQWRACGRLCDVLAADILTGIATREEVEDEFAQQRAELEEQAEAARRGEVPANLGAPPQAKAPAARDFRAEADALKTKLTAAVTSKSKAEMAEFHKQYKAFKADAPAELSEEIQKFYSAEASKARKPGSAAAAAPPLPVPTSAPEAPAGDGSKAAPEPPENAGDAWEPPAADGTPFR